VFATLSDLEESLKSGDRAGVRATLEGLEIAIDQFVVGVSEIGARAQRLDQNQARIEDVKLSLEKLVSQEEDLDLFKAVSDLTRHKIILEATLQSNQTLFETLQSY
jgi:flagellin-like hook-associated protein FlgL